MDTKDMTFIINNGVNVFKDKVEFNTETMRASSIIGMEYEDDNYIIFEMNTPKGILFVNVSRELGICTAFRTLESAKGYAKIFNMIQSEINLEYLNPDNFTDGFIDSKDLNMYDKIEFKINNPELFKKNKKAMN